METPWLDDLFRQPPQYQQRLKRLLTHAQQDAMFVVHSKASYYPYFAKVFVLKELKRQKQPGMEPKYKIPRKPREEGEQDEDDVKKSLQRSKSHVRDYIHCNRFDLFCTFTFKDDRHDIDKCRRKMSDWLKNQQKRNGKFPYLIVPELHKDGALHFHALFKDYPGKVEKATNVHTGELLRPHGRQAYNLTGYTLGFTNAMQIVDSASSYAKMASYVSKYITKDMPLFPGKKRYWPSRKLRKPIVEYNPAWIDSYKPDKAYEGEYGTTYFYLNSYVIPPKYRVELFKVQTLPGILDEPS